MVNPLPNPAPVRRSGFSLVEVLVAVVLFLLVMVLLLRGVDAVTATVSRGQRRSEIHRVMKSARRVMQEDFTAMLHHPDWNRFIGDPEAETPQLMAAFLRYRTGTEGATETEWVQYWREAHATEARLEKWVRYAGPATSRMDHLGDWWESVDRSSLSGETLLDDLVQLDLEMITVTGAVTGVVTQKVDAVDVRLLVTVPPFPEITGDEETRFLDKMWAEDAGWMHFRAVPESQGGPRVSWDL